MDGGDWGEGKESYGAWPRWWSPWYKRVNKRVKKLQGGRERERHKERTHFYFCGACKILYGHKTRLRAKRMRFLFETSSYTTDTAEFFPGISKREILGTFFSFFFCVFIIVI